MNTRRFLSVVRLMFVFTVIGAQLVGISTANALTPVHLWSQRFGGAGIDTGRSTTADAAGNVFVAGHFTGTTNLGGSNLVSAGSYDICLAKYTANGVHQWSQRFGGLGEDRVSSVAVDASGNVFLTGSFTGTANFGGGDLISVGQDMFLAKYSTSGGHLWSQHFGGPSNTLGQALAVDASGNVFVTGAFVGDVNFGGGSLVSVGLDYDVFLTKYNASGLHQWSQRFGDTGGDWGFSVGIDASGNVIVTGLFSGTVSFGGGNLVSGGQGDIFLAKYSAGGTHQWSKGFGSTGQEQGADVALDGAGNVFVTGGFASSVDFGGGLLVSSGSDDIFLAKFDASGTHQWSQRFGGASSDQGFSVAMDGSANVLLTGYFETTVNFGGGNLVSTGGDVFVAKYNASGSHQWSLGAGGTLGDSGECVATDAAGNVILVANFSNTINFGGGLLTSLGSADVCLAKLGGDPAEPTITAIADIGNDQGRRVRISFDRSGRDDALASDPITRYVAYRRIDTLPAASVANDVSSAPAILAVSGYEFAGEIPAFGEDSYHMIVPTLADSTLTLGQHYSAFFVRAATESPATFYDSPVDSGYSLDNLAPVAPQNLVYDTGGLSWNESNAADFDFFSVYGSNTNSYGAATLVDYSVAPTLDVSASSYVYYFVTATDFSGNESKPAVVNTLSGVGGTPSNYVLSLSAYPNPFNPETTVRYTLPARGRVTIEVFDARGAHVATLIDHAERAAGAHSIAWDGRARSGATVGTGVYFARLTSPAGTKSYKLTLLK